MDYLDYACEPFTPYIGVKNLEDSSQIDLVLETFKKSRARGSKRRLQIGVVTENRLPPPHIYELFSSDETMNCLHFVDRGNRDRDHDLSTALYHAICASGTGINALQVSKAWPDPGQLWSGVHNTRKNIEVILHIGKDALEEAGNDPKEVVARLEDYEEDVIHHVLLGDDERLLPFARAIRDRFPIFGIGWAGGLGSGTMHLAATALQEFPDSSIECEDDPVNIVSARQYVTDALAMTG